MRDIPSRKSRSRQKSDNSPLLEGDGAEDNDELSEMEDEVEYYSLYDQPYPELESIQENVEQDSRRVQEEARPKQRSQGGISDDQHVQMVNESIPEYQVARTSFDVSTLNPEAPVFELQYDVGDRPCEVSRGQHSPVPETVSAEESIPNVPVTDLIEHCTPINGTNIGLNEMEEECKRSHRV